MTPEQKDDNDIIRWSKNMKIKDVDTKVYTRKVAIMLTFIGELG